MKPASTFAVRWLALVLLLPVLSGEDPTTIPLGPLGGSGSITTGKAHVQITKLLANAPGVTGGLKENDLLIGAFGEAFTATPKAGYTGATQDLALAIERAEAADGKLALRVLRPGKGEIDVTVKLPAVGAYGPAYPLGSDKYAATYQYACDKIANRVIGDPDQGFNGGWFGLALLGHPQWKGTYAKAIAALRDAALKKFAADNKNAFAYAPVEDVLLDGKSKNPHAEANNGGPGNWELGSWVMFLAEYRRKTKDTSVDAVLQRAAETCANRIQWWKQPPLHANGYSPEFKDIAGIVSHGGVTGDYIHIGWGGGINMTGVHIFCALAFAKQAGVKMDAKPKDGHYFGFPVAPVGAVPAGMEAKDFTLSEKFDMQLAWLYRCSGDGGEVGYTTGQGGSAWDAAGRTAGTLVGLLASGRKLDQTDEQRVAKIKAYIAREYARLMETHAYTHGGQCFTQLALPFLDDRSQRYLMENWRLFYVLSRLPDGTITYFGGRGNNGGDGYLDNDKVMETVWALSGSVAHAGLPYVAAIPGQDKDRVYVGFTAPYVRWPKLETRTATVVGRTHDFQIDVVGANGLPLKGKKHTVTWSSFKGSASFTATKNPNVTKVTFPGPGTFRLLLTVKNGDYTLQEPLEVEVLPGSAVAEADASQRPQRPEVTTQPQPTTTTLGGAVTFAVEATGRGPLSFDWRLDGVSLWPKRNSPSLTLANVGGGQAGAYDCIVTGADGVVTSKPALLTISDTGAIVAGGLWCEHFTDPAIASSSTLEVFLAHGRFPRWSDASMVLGNTIETAPRTEPQGQRLSGWLTPPTSGSYQFFVAGNGHAQVLLSSDDLMRNRKLLVSHSVTTGVRQWSAGARSKPTLLQAGKRYYIEVVHLTTSDTPASIALAWRAVTTAAGSRKDDAAPEDGSPAMSAALFEHRVGGMFEELKVTLPARAAPAPSAPTG
jgi:Family of unknown function (DUF6288)/Immunoglobulin I-set domain